MHVAKWIGRCNSCDQTPATAANACREIANVSSSNPSKAVTVVGAGIIGLWQALSLARAGHSVHLIERTPKPFAESASRHAGAMIAPYCEAEAAPMVVRDLGLVAARIWRETVPELVQAGTLVVANPRDQSELRRFQRMTTGHQVLDADGLATLEPDLAGRFQTALFFPDEAHLTTPDVLSRLLRQVTATGARVSLGQDWDRMSADDGWTIDCRGLSGRADVAKLRGVRGERIVIRSRDVSLARPVRLLHPRHPLYVVPWTDDRYLVGATVIESEDTTPMTVRSALELLGLVYALHPGFGEAEVVELDAGVRPSFPDHVPRIVVEADDRIIRVNGAYRHGFLLAPVLASAVCDFLATGAEDHPLFSDVAVHL